MFVPYAPIMPVFHHLPKVHKGTNPFVGEPKVAGIGSLKDRFGEWIDHQLQPLEVSLPGFLRNTKQLPVKLRYFECNPYYLHITYYLLTYYLLLTYYSLAQVGHL